MILTIRAPSGLSGDMLVAGLACLLSKKENLVQDTIDKMYLPISIQAGLEDHSVNHIAGKRLNLKLPHEHSHRNLEDIVAMIASMDLSKRAKAKAVQTFELLADAEARIHQKPKEKITFHEVGSLDSIVDIVLSCVFLDMLNAERYIVSPLPIADGSISMQHGLIFSPAPAVLKLIEDVPVYGVEPEGETVTPTAIALLKAWPFEFGFWPVMILKQSEIVFGGKMFQKLPNGAIFAVGEESALRS